jgi:hypothetical protein
MLRIMATRPKRIKTKESAAARAKRRRGWTIATYNSFAEADQANREYCWSRTPLERMQALEALRAMNHGYGKGKPLPRFESVLRDVNITSGEAAADAACRH